MKRRPLNARERLMAVGTLAVLLGTLLIRAAVLPAYDRWSYWRQTAAETAEEQARLTRHFAIRERVEAEFASLPPEAMLDAADEITISTFLRDIEIMARYPSMTVLSMRAMPVKRAASHREYQVRVSVAGKLDEILRFNEELTAGKLLVDLRSFSLRGQQGRDQVEASLDIALIKLERGPAGASTRPAPAEPAAEVARAH